jgi:hypothetical protein
MWKIDGVEEVATGADARWFKWWLRNPGGHEVFVVVKIARSVMSTGLEFLPPHAAAAVSTFGRSEVEKILSWSIPPRSIEVLRHRLQPKVEERDALPIGP